MFQFKIHETTQQQQKMHHYNTLGISLNSQMGGVSTEYEMVYSSYSCYVSSLPFSTNWLPLLPSLALPSFASLLFLFLKTFFRAFTTNVLATSIYN